MGSRRLDVADTVASRLPSERPNPRSCPAKLISPSTANPIATGARSSNAPSHRLTDSGVDSSSASFAACTGTGASCRNSRSIEVNPNSWHKSRSSEKSLGAHLRSAGPTSNGTSGRMVANSPAEQRFFFEIAQGVAVTLLLRLLVVLERLVECAELADEFCGALRPDVTSLLGARREGRLLTREAAAHRGCCHWDPPSAPANPRPAKARRPGFP